MSLANAGAASYGIGFMPGRRGTAGRPAENVTSKDRTGTIMDDAHGHHFTDSQATEADPVAGAEASAATGRRVVIFSMRAIAPDLSRCSGYEFEDVVAGLEGAELVVPERQTDRRINFRGRRWLSRRTPLFRFVPSGTRGKPLEADCDLFCCILQKPFELLDIDSVPNWRQRSRLAVCVLEELWQLTIDEFRPLVKSLEQFDLLACAFEHTCARLSEITGRPVIHLPGAADLLRFAPRALETERPIDVFYMGRRRPELHAAIRDALDARNGFYLHDTFTHLPLATSHQIHRDMLANLVRRSKLFMVDFGKVGHVDQARGEQIWGPRHVEGLAGGAIQVGYAPDTADYSQFFDWPESIERLPEEADRALEVLLRLIDDPAELERRRRINLSQALHKHDWLHRWQLILDHFGLPETPQMSARRRDLAALDPGAA